MANITKLRSLPGIARMASPETFTTHDSSPSVDRSFPWGKFRDKVIENQDKYDNVKFQNDYASNMCVNFPHRPMKALIFQDGQIMVSKMLEAFERH
jgi:hypothetical protein